MNEVQTVAELNSNRIGAVPEQLGRNAGLHLDVGTQE